MFLFFFFPNPKPIILLQEGTCVDGKIVSDDKIACPNMKTDKIEGFDGGFHLEEEKPMNIGDLSDPRKSSLDDIIEQRGTKRVNDGELDADNKRCQTVIIDSDDDTDAIEDKLDSNINTVEDQSKVKGLSKSGADSLPSECLDEKFHCTICDKVALEVHPHPLLKVIICGDCKCLLEEKIDISVRKFKATSVLLGSCL